MLPHALLHLNRYQAEAIAADCLLPDYSSLELSKKGTGMAKVVAPPSPHARAFETSDPETVSQDPGVARTLTEIGRLCW